MTVTRGDPAGSRGYALIVALIILILLTLLALGTMRSAKLDARMSTNNSTRAEALESSELPRTAVVGLIDALCHAGGWPTAIGGDADTFDATIPAGLSIVDTDGKPDIWCSMTHSGFDPANPETSANFALNYPSGGSSPAVGDVTVAARVAVRRLYVGGAPGSGQAQAYGYSSPGISMANGGGNIFFYVNSHGMQKDAGGNPLAGYNTSSTFRYVIRN